MVRAVMDQDDESATAGEAYCPECGRPFGVELPATVGLVGGLGWWPWLIFAVGALLTVGLGARVVLSLVALDHARAMLTNTAFLVSDQTGHTVASYGVGPAEAELARDLVWAAIGPALVALGHQALVAVRKGQGLPTMFAGRAAVGFGGILAGMLGTVVSAVETLYLSAFWALVVAVAAALGREVARGEELSPGLVLSVVDRIAQFLLDASRLLG
jgi:hypothetical protein